MAAVLVLAASAAGCSDAGPTGEPHFESRAGCGSQYRWVCPDMLVPGAHAPGDPMSEMCSIAFSQGYLGNIFWSGDAWGNGATRTTMEYDDAGRPIAMVSDCGLSEPLASVFHWSPEGVFEVHEFANAVDLGEPDARYQLDCRDPKQEGKPGCPERNAVYDASGRLLRTEGYGGSDAHDFELDDQQRIVREAYIYPRTATEMVIAHTYDGPRLTARAATLDGVTTTFRHDFDDQGRLVGYEMEYSDGSPPSHQPPTWIWSDGAVTVENDEYRVEVVLDDAGRPVHMDGYRPKDTAISTADWTWRADGRLDEVFFEEWGWDL